MRSRSSDWSMSCSGSGAPRSGSVSSSEIASPVESDTLHSSSSATIVELEIWSRASWKSSTLTFSSVAISSSVGARWKRASSFMLARSISRARARTERGTQSSVRSSSMIAPRMRVIAYVSNLISRLRSKRWMAEISPPSP